MTSLAVDGKVAASTQNQALSALLFLYREVLQQEVPWLDESQEDFVRARFLHKVIIALGLFGIPLMALAQERGAPARIGVLGSCHPKTLPTSLPSAKGSASTAALRARTSPSTHDGRGET